MEARKDGQEEQELYGQPALDIQSPTSTMTADDDQLSIKVHEPLSISEK